MSVNAEDRRPWNVLALLVAAQFMVVLDITIVNVALPSIGRALAFAAGDLPWVVTAYVLSAGGLYLVGGRLADLAGRRATFLMGLTVFTVASLACGLAEAPGPLIAARAVQGAGAALLTPSALSILAVTYMGEQRTRALAIWGAVGSAGAAVGVVAGGMLTSWLSWEWVFWVNVPVGVAVAVFAPRVIAVPPPPERFAWRALDLPGAAASVAGLVALVYGISERELPLAAAGVVLLVAFLALERRVARPLVAPATWRTPALAPGAVAMLAATGLVAGTFFLTSVQLQRVLGWSALQTGLGFLPLVVAIAAGVHLAAHAIGRVGSRALLAAGLALVAVGAVVGSGGAYASAVLPGTVLLGLGFGLTFPSISIAAMSGVGHDGAGTASGLMSAAHEVGAALGVAVLSSVAGAAFAFGDAMVAMAIAAGALSALALVAAPAVRPAEGARVAAH